jgi:hypothetical protein
MTIVITAWDRSPDGGMGLARDMRVRWALEEVGQPYEVRLVSLRGRATSPGQKSACLWSKSASAIEWSNFLPAWGMPTGSMGRTARATS